MLRICPLFAAHFGPTDLRGSSVLRGPFTPLTIGQALSRSPLHQAAAAPHLTDRGSRTWTIVNPGTACLL